MLWYSLAVLVESPPERPDDAGGVAYEQQLAAARRHHGIDGLVDVLAHPLRLVDDDEHVGRVEALKLVHLVGRESKCKAVLVQFEAGLEHVASDVIRGGAMEAADLPPKDVPDLAGGGSGGEDGGGLVGIEEPEDGDGGGEALAEAVAGLDGDTTVVANGAQDLLLLVP